MPNFDQLHLIKPLKKSLQEQGFHVPTPIQLQSIPAILQGRDILALAQTGSGKTAAYLLPILQMLAPLTAPPKGAPYALVVAPTRELALQIESQCRLLSKHVSVHCEGIVGGMKPEPQIQKIQARPIDVLIATPGRLLDLIAKKYISITSTPLLVLDEVDRMLDMGFLPDINRLYALLPKKKQCLFFSATFPAQMSKIAHRLLYKPIRIEVKPSNQPNNITQKVMFVQLQNKFPLLLSLLQQHQEPSIVFTKTKKTAQRLCLLLQKEGLSVTSIHGDKSQHERVKAMNAFAHQERSILVATDIAARGIDIEHVQYVYNHNIPPTPETYTHRIGRTGRAGKKGYSISLCDVSEANNLVQVEVRTGATIIDDVEHKWHCPQSFQQTIIHRTEELQKKPPNKKSPKRNSHKRKPRRRR